MATVAITINSRQYDVVANESAEYIEMLGNHINEKVNLVLKGGRNVMGERPVVLAALNICDEYFKAEESVRMLKEQLHMNAEKLSLAQTENQKLKAAGKKTEQNKGEGTQVSIGETPIGVQTVDAKKQLEEAGTQIKFLEGQIEVLESKIKKMEQDYAQRQKNFSYNQNKR